MAGSLNKNELLARMARDYYIKQKTIAELSNKYNMSRYLVTKSLKEATDSGLVTIEIHSPLVRNVQLEEQFQKTFGLDHPVILKVADSPNENAKNVIETAAKQLQRLIQKSHIVGLTWGGTIYDLIDQFQQGISDNLTFTQFLGENMKYNSAAGSTRMVERAAAKFNSTYQTIPAPLYVVNDAARKALPNEPALTTSFASAKRMDLLISGLGTLSSIDSIPAWKQAKNLIFPGVVPNQIVGMLFGRPYDINGNFLLPEKDTVLGISLPEIMAVPRRYGIVKSKFKTYSALGALRGKMLTDLVMTESIAQKILLANDET